MSEMSSEMSIKKQLEEVLKDGFTILYKPVTRTSKSVKECVVIASKSGYDVLYMEAHSNWKGNATKVIMEQRNKCLLFTEYRGSLICSTTTGFSGQRDRKARHVIIEIPSIKKFINYIKNASKKEAGRGEIVDAVHIDLGVQSAITKFSQYKEAFDEFGENLAEVIKKTKARVKKAAKDNKKYQAEASKFLDLCHKIINKAMKKEDVEDMLVQHILTSRIFAMVYDNEKFHETNTVAKSLEKLKNLLNLPAEKVNYEKIEIIAESITDSDQRQEFLKNVYERYYKKHDPERAKKDGIVYTPSEVVNFMVKSVNYLLETEFHRDLSSDGVNILDPCTGTGTFPAHIMREIGTEHLKKKYDQIYANEISILPYYIAALNIENTYQEMTNNNDEFKNICWMDTLDGGMKNFGKILEYIEDEKENVERIQKQQDSKIDVVIGNPPYAVMENNRYDEFDEKIAETYVDRTKKINPNIGLVGALYDSYVRFFRWASSRIENKGIVAFISNGSFIRTEAMSGMRACLSEEFTDVWCFDLRGDQRTKGETSRKEGGKIFGSGSRTPITITILVKNPEKKKHSIHYKDIGDYLTREEKLGILENAGSIDKISGWSEIKADANYDWLDHRNPEFSRYVPMGNKDAKAGKDTNMIFKIFSMGVSTSRDEIIYNSTEKKLSENVKKFIDFCNDSLKLGKLNRKGSGVELSKKLERLGEQTFDEKKIRKCLYRPFFKQNMYFDSILNHRQYKIPKLFPKKDSKNLGICIPDKENAEIFSTMMINTIIDLSLVKHAQCFPFYYLDDYNSMCENITDDAKQQYQEHYNNKDITKKDVFYYIYGLLHHKGYKEKFKNNLSREFPRIPMAPNFQKIGENGKKLAELHLNFDTCQKYSLKPKFQPESFIKLNFAQRVKKTKKDGTLDTTKIKIDDGSKQKLLFEDIPEIEYRVNGRTPVEWIVDRYKMVFDKDGKIINDPCTGTDIISVTERAVYVGIESDKLIKEISELQFEPNEKDKPPMPGEKTNPKKNLVKSDKVNHNSKKGKSIRQKKQRSHNQTQIVKKGQQHL